MNDEPGHADEKPVSKAVWLLVALSPAVLIALTVLAGTNYGGLGGPALNLVAFGLNPLVSIFGSYRMLSRPELEKWVAALGAIFLGAVLAVVNVAVGVFAGCSCGGR